MDLGCGFGFDCSGGCGKLRLGRKRAREREKSIGEKTITNRRVSWLTVFRD